MRIQSTIPTANKRTRTHWRKAKIVLQVHPLCGEKIFVGSHYGPDSVWAETPDGRLTIIPVCWTDLQPRRPELSIGSKIVCLDPDATKALVEFVQSRMAESGGSKKIDTYQSTLREINGYDRNSRKIDCEPGAIPKGSGNGSCARQTRARGDTSALVEQTGSQDGGRTGRRRRNKRQGRS